MSIEYADPQIDYKELEKAKTINVVDLIEYVSNSTVCRTILKRLTGNISVMSFDYGKGVSVKALPFDLFMQIIEGRAEIAIDNVSKVLDSGQGIIVPAHTPHFIKPGSRFKMLTTIIKSGYE
jgi:mannose-6-phosphate isomerase-like protein (cupin superfamily)